MNHTLAPSFISPSFHPSIYAHVDHKNYSLSLNHIPILRLTFNIFGLILFFRLVGEEEEEEKEPYKAETSDK